MSSARPASWIELSRSALAANLDFLRRSLPEGTRLSSVVKGNAYGHDLATYVPLAESLGVEMFWTFSTEEAVVAHTALRSPDTRLGIMGYVPAEDLEWVIANDVAFFAFDLARIDAAQRVAKRVGRPARLHLEVETGLFRTGLSERALRTAAERIAKSPDCLVAEGLCTHLAGAESFANHVRVARQLAIFRQRSALLTELGFPGALRHTACSAGAFNYPEACFDLVRFGIAQYGYWPSPETYVAWLRARPGRARKRSPLRRVLEWKSRVMDLTQVPFGEFVGYGNSFQAERRTQLAIVPIGYSAGFPRSQSNLGYVLIRGAVCPLVGTINMNLLTVDVTDRPGVKKGDEVVLIGHQEDREISVASFADRTKSFNYETLVRLDESISRRVVPGRPTPP
ncbi:MAG: alanine racemase [Planctomycetota bacterium]